jgi:hypothetical protein
VTPLRVLEWAGVAAVIASLLLTVVVILFAAWRAISGMRG